MIHAGAGAVPGAAGAAGTPGAAGTAGAAGAGADDASASHAGTPVIELRSLVSFDTFAGFERWLQTPGPWVGAFDFPFGLPRALLADWGWCAPRAPDPLARRTSGDPPRAGEPGAADPDPGWAVLTERLAAIGRPALVERLRAFCDARPVGGKFAHRSTDAPAGSSPSMKWINPPVALMLHEGAPRLLRAGVHLPGLGVAGDPMRVALEGYPGLVARALIGRTPYKSDDRARQTPERTAARARIIASLEAGAAAAPVGSPAAALGSPAAPAAPAAPAFQLEQPVRFDPLIRQRCLDDASGDSLDAVLCTVLAAWGWRRRADGWGLPADTDPLEGWIVGA